MIVKNVLEIIESKYDVFSLTLKSKEKFWPLIRQKMYFEIIRKTLNYNNKLRTRNKKQLFINFFIGFGNVFKIRRFDYLFFNNSDKRILIENKYYDIFFDAWADKLGQEKSLFIEWAINKHYSKNKIHSKNRISDLFFKSIITFITFFTKTVIEDDSILSKIKEEYELDCNFNDEIKIKKAEITFYKWLLKFTNPKGVFVLSSFTKISIVIAAKELGIKVFEAQHGYIGDSHPFYFTEKPFKKTYPDYLFSFGNYEKLNNDSRLIFNSEQIIPVGNLQLEIIKKKATSSQLINLKDNYKCVFCVTLQAIKEEEMLKWITKEANSHKDWLFILRPKNNELSYSNYTKHENIIEMPDYSIYDILKISNFNITIFSTTAIEGVFLGAPPIFYNTNNLSKKYFNTSKMKALVIEEGDTLPNSIMNLEITNQNSYFVDDYKLNVKQTELCF